MLAQEAGKPVKWEEEAGRRNALVRKVRDIDSWLD